MVDGFATYQTPQNPEGFQVFLAPQQATAETSLV
jgi:hypothetical protein